MLNEKGSRFNLTDFVNLEPEKYVRELMKDQQLTFKEVCSDFEKQFEEEISKASKSDKEAKSLLVLQHEAITGVPSSVTELMEKIQTFLHTRGINSIEIPNYYKGLVSYANEDQQKFDELTHAIFHEVYGFGPLAFWNKYPDEYAAQIIGTKIFLDIDGEKKLMEFEFENLDRVNRIIDNLTYQHEEVKISRYNPTMEVDMYTGERVKVMIPPRVRHPTLTFRRFLIGYVQLETLAEKRSFPAESIPIFKAISKTHCNTAIVGPPGTGKSTFMKGMFYERNKRKTGNVIESHYELALSKHFPDRPIVETIADEGKFHHAMDDALRTDVDFVIIGELRRVEVEGVMLACERVQKGMMVTYHTWKPNSIAAQWARQILDLFPTRNWEAELTRVADNLDIIIELIQSEDKKHKWVNSIQEMCLNDKTNEIYTNYLMRYDQEKKKWEYNSNVSPKLVSEMRQINQEWTTKMITTLAELEKQSPMTIDPIDWFNPQSEQPLFRIANAAEEMFKR